MQRTLSRASVGHYVGLSNFCENRHGFFLKNHPNEQSIFPRARLPELRKRD